MYHFGRCSGDLMDEFIDDCEEESLQSSESSSMAEMGGGGDPTNGQRSSLTGTISKNSRASEPMLMGPVLTSHLDMDSPVTDAVYVDPFKTHTEGTPKTEIQNPDTKTEHDDELVNTSARLSEDAPWKLRSNDQFWSPYITRSEQQCDGKSVLGPLGTGHTEPTHVRCSDALVGKKRNSKSSDSGYYATVEGSVCSPGDTLLVSASEPSPQTHQASLVREAEETTSLGLAMPDHISSSVFYGASERTISYESPRHLADSVGKNASVQDRSSESPAMLHRSLKNPEVERFQHPLKQKSMDSSSQLQGCPDSPSQLQRSLDKSPVQHPKSVGPAVKHERPLALSSRHKTPPESVSCLQETLSPPQLARPMEPSSQHMGRFADSSASLLKTADSTATQKPDSHSATVAESALGDDHNSSSPSLGSGTDWLLEQEQTISQAFVPSDLTLRTRDVKTTHEHAHRQVEGRHISASVSQAGAVARTEPCSKTAELPGDLGQGTLETRTTEPPATGWPELSPSWQESYLSWQRRRYTSDTQLESPYDRPKSSPSLSNVSPQRPGASSSVACNTRAQIKPDQPDSQLNVYSGTPDINQTTSDVRPRITDIGCRTSGPSEKIPDIRRSTDTSQKIRDICRRETENPTMAYISHATSEICQKMQSISLKAAHKDLRTRSVGPCMKPQQSPTFDKEMDSTMLATPSQSPQASLGQFTASPACDLASHFREIPLSSAPHQTSHSPEIPLSSAPHQTGHSHEIPLSSAPRQTSHSPEIPMSSAPHQTGHSYEIPMSSAPHQTSRSPDIPMSSAPHQTIRSPDIPMSSAPHQTGHSHEIPLSSAPHQTGHSHEISLSSAPHQTGHSHEIPLSSAPHQTSRSPEIPMSSAPHQTGHSYEIPLSSAPHQTSRSPDIPMSSAPHQTSRSPDIPMSSAPHQTSHSHKIPMSSAPHQTSRSPEIPMSSAPHQTGHSHEIPLSSVPHQTGHSHEIPLSSAPCQTSHSHEIPMSSAPHQTSRSPEIPMSSAPCQTSHFREIPMSSTPLQSSKRPDRPMRNVPLPASIDLDLTMPNAPDRAGHDLSLSISDTRRQTSHHTELFSTSTSELPVSSVQEESLNGSDEHPRSVTRYRSGACGYLTFGAHGNATRGASEGCVGGAHEWFPKGSSPSGGDDDDNALDLSRERAGDGERGRRRRPDYHLQRSGGSGLSSDVLPSLPVPSLSAAACPPLLPAQAQTWVEMDVDKEHFVRTAILEEAQEVLDSYSVVLLTGPPHSGKTTLGRALLRDADHSRWTCCTITNVSEWRKWVGSGEPLIVLLDEVFGRTQLNKDKEEAWKQTLEGMDELRRQGSLRLIFTVNPTVLESLRQARLGRNLISAQHQVSMGPLRVEEKREMLYRILRHKVDTAAVAMLETEARNQDDSRRVLLQEGCVELGDWDRLMEMMAGWVLENDQSGSLFPDGCLWLATTLSRYNGCQLLPYLESALKIFSRPAPLYRDIVLQLLQDRDLDLEKTQAVLCLLLAGMDVTDANKVDTIVSMCQSLGFGCACSPVGLQDTLQAMKNTLVVEGSAKFINRHAYCGTALALGQKNCSMVVKVVDLPFLVKGCRVPTKDAAHSEVDDNLMPFQLEIRRVKPDRSQSSEYQALVGRLAAGLEDPQNMVLAVQHPVLQCHQFVQDLKLFYTEQGKNVKSVLSQNGDSTHGMSLLYWSVFNSDLFLFGWIFKTVIGKLRGSFRKEDLVKAAYACCVLRNKVEFLKMLLKYWKKATSEDLSVLLKGQHLFLPLPRAEACLVSCWQNQLKHINDVYTSSASLQRGESEGAAAAGFEEQSEKHKKQGLRSKGMNLFSPPLLVAVEFNNEKIVDLLMTYCGDMLTVRDGQGRTALHVAAHYGHINIIRKLLEHRELLRMKDDNRNTALDVAWLRQYEEVMALLQHAENDQTQ